MTVLPEISYSGGSSLELIENYAIQLFEAASTGKEAPEAPKELNENDIIIATHLANNNTDFVNAFDDRRKAILTTKQTNLEGGAFQALESHRQKLGKGTGDGLMDKIDKTLADKMVDIGIYSTAKGGLKSPEVRNKAMKDIGSNIENIFEYLDGWRWNGLDFYQEGSSVVDLIDGKFSPGSAEWIANMDIILNSYLPIDETTGVRKESSVAASKTIPEFLDGGKESGEENGYKLLLNALEAYAALRAVDASLGQDPVNPFNLDLTE